MKTTLQRGTVCCVAPQPFHLSAARVISHHPEAKAVTVNISGDEWILKECEVIRRENDSAWPSWLTQFLTTLRATKSRKKDSKDINKAEAARKLALPYSRVLSMCELLEQVGITLKPQ